MNNKISTIRIVAKNLAPHLCTEGKIKISRPNAIIPGAVAAAGTVITLETKDNNAKLVVQKDNAEVQSAEFNYEETTNGYELLSASSAYFYDDKDNKEIHQNLYFIEPKKEEIHESTISYANAPIRKTTRAYIDKINSSIAQTSGYKSDKTDYDPQESHTYGKKSLQRDIPALLKFLEIIAPNAEYTLTMKDKLKKDNKTSLVAFKVNESDGSKEIVKGFMSANGDSVSYHLDTNDLIIIGEQSQNKDMSRTYLKPEESLKTKKGLKAEKKDSSKKEIKGNNKQKSTNTVSTKNKSEITTQQSNSVYPKEYYKNLIVEAATNKNLLTRKKVDVYAKTLAMAYLDGYNKSELVDILTADGLLEFSSYCKRTYVQMGIALAEQGDIKSPVKSLDNKIKELENIKIDIDDEALKICVYNMINEIAKIKDDSNKEASVDKALNIIQNNSSNLSQADLLAFVQEFSKINDDFKLHYAIYEESVNNIKVQNLRSQIEQKINHISDTDNHEKRDNFLTQLYILKDLQELEQLQNEVQNLLDNQSLMPVIAEELPIQESLKRPDINSLSKNNKELVKMLIRARARKTSLSFNQVDNLLRDIGFVEKNGNDSSHHTYDAPFEIIIKGSRRPFLTLAGKGSRNVDVAAVADLINICKQYYGDDN